jgi:hypothetical protein
MMPPQRSISSAKVLKFGKAPVSFYGCNYCDHMRQGGSFIRYPRPLI